MSSHPGRRLGSQVLHARSEHWVDRKAFARATGLSVRVLADMETGVRTNFSEQTYAAIEATLGWEPGSCERVQLGGRPRLLDDPEMRRLREMWPLLSDEIRRTLVVLVEQIIRI